MAARIMPLLDMGSVPSLGTLLGTKGRSDILQQISKEWGDGGTKFGLEGDLYRNNHLSFLTGIVDKVDQASNILSSAQILLEDRSDIVPITTDEQLDSVPSSMWVPLLTMPPLRRLLKDNVVYGFGMDDSDLPEEDVAGRLINNGRRRLRVGKECDMIWSWKSTDPEYSVQNLDDLEESRKFVWEFLAHQMKQLSHDRIDPTDYPNKMICIKPVYEK